MLSISDPKSAGTGANYYWNYYERDAVEKALTLGRGAEAFGLKDGITKKQFSFLFNGFSPNGKVGLVKNAGDPGRQAAWDLTFSVPKSVSVLWVSASKQRKKQIEKVILRSVKKTLECAEERYILSRQGAGGREWVPAALTFVLFFHISSRENEPQLHVHCLMFNLGIRRDGSVGTLQTKPLFDAKITLGKFFSHDLAQGLKEELGLQTKEQAVGFHVEGVPKILCDINSTRRKQIVDNMALRGKTNGKAAKEAALETRRAKSHIPKDQLVETWSTGATAFGWTAEHAERLFVSPKKQHHKTNDVSLEHAKELPKNAPQFANELTASHTPELIEHETKKPLWRQKAENAGWTPAQIDLIHHQAAAEQKRFQDELARERLLFGSNRNYCSLKEYLRKDRVLACLARLEQVKNEHAEQATHGHREETRKANENTKAKGDHHQETKAYKKALKAFAKELRVATDKIFPEKQTRKKVEKIAFAIGRKFEIRANDILSAIDDLKLPIHRTLYRVEWQRVFPKAPQWSPVSKIRTPRIVLANKARKWGEIYYSKSIWSIGGAKTEFRIQERKLFPKAPAWSPFSKMSLPAFRVGPVRPHAEAAKRKEKEQKEKIHSM